MKYYRLNDGRIYSVQDMAFVALPEGAEAIDVPGGTIADLKKLLDFYLLPVGDCLLTPEELLESRREAIDAETSEAILSGFDYEINGQSLHFSYDSFDQQNFSDTANACMMKQTGAEGLPDSVTWNGYASDGALVRLTLTAPEFLALYVGGALAHKAACMEAGGAKKAALA